MGTGFVVRFCLMNPGSKGFVQGLSRFGPGFGPFLAKHVRSSSFLERFEWVQNLVLVDEPGFN